MNDTISILKNHRTIRSFTNQVLPQDHIEQAIASGQQASTSSNIQAYSILQVDDPAKRAKLVTLTGGQQQVEYCGAFFIISGDLHRHAMLAKRDGHELSLSLESFLLATIDATLFAQNVIVAFESMGYGICCIGGLRNDLPAIQHMFEFPQGVFPLFGLCVGVPEGGSGCRPRFGAAVIHTIDTYSTDEDLQLGLDEYDEVCKAYYQHRSGTPRDWSSGMGTKFAEPLRAGLAAYYNSQGASFE